MRYLIVAILLGLVGCGQVDPGERAVFTTWGKMDQRCYAEGFYWYNVFTTSMRELDIKVRKYEVKKLTAASQDLQEIHADVVVNYGLDGSLCHKLLTEVGYQYEATLIVPATTEALKAGTAHFPIDKIIRERARLKEEIVASLRARLAPYGVHVTDVALTDFGFAHSFTQAVERKQIEEQRVQEAEYRRQQAVKNAESAVALAKGQSEANRLLAESLRQSPETIRFRELEMLEKKWNGVMPQTILGGAVPFISVGPATGGK